MGKKEPILVGFLYVTPGRGGELTDIAKTLEFNEAEQSLLPPAFRLVTG